ncbi:integrase, catalytic region, zinc finger, CCHC-type containing protein, partial [Tanacetum coccineum]
IYLLAWMGWNADIEGRGLDGENLDKMKEKGDVCTFVGYSTTSRGYRVYNKRTRLIVETIHVNIDELPIMAKCLIVALKQDNLSIVSPSQNNVPQEAETVTTSLNELDILFSPMFDEYFNVATIVVSKSSAFHTADATDKHQQSNTTQSTSTTVAEEITQLNIQTTFEPITHESPIPTTENINQAENVNVDEDKFINIFSTTVHEVEEPSSRHVDPSNMHTFYQRHPSKQQWTKDHSLEEVIKNPSQPVRTRRQLETDGKMCMFALTVSRTEPKNIKEAMVDYAWIEAMHDELHQFK